MDTNPEPVPVAQSGLNFDLLQQPAVKTSNSGTFDDLMLTSSYQGVPPPSGFGITLSDNNLSANDFKT